MRIICDTHTHTIASGHAHSTVGEYVDAALALAHRFLVISDHAGAIEGAPAPEYFRALRAILPLTYKGIYLIAGCEANIIDAQGRLDLSHDILSSLDWVIASLHTLAISPEDKQTHTYIWLKVAENPDVDVIGHCGDQRFSFDHERAMRAFKEYGKIVEINAHSFAARPNSLENCRNIALMCKKYRVPVVCSSDAHFLTRIGDVSAALEMLKSIDFPEELVLNADARRFARVLEQKTGRVFITEE